MNCTRINPPHHGRSIRRRELLKATALAGMSWLTPLAGRLARAAENERNDPRPCSVIVLWMQGGPSQLETFDPHPGSKIAAGTAAIPTVVEGIQLASGLEQLAEQMDFISLVRSVVSQEGDHERATYNMKTGFRPDPTLLHPSLGAIICHHLPDRLEIPRHISIQPGAWPARGGYLGDQYDAFQIGDPEHPIPDVQRPVDQARSEARVNDLLNIVEQEFARGRMRDLDAKKTLHGQSIRAALSMMTSEQLAAFDISQESLALQQQFGETPFGRGCLTALRLIQAGVRCVEVTLNGWDSHINNHETQATRVAELDPAFASLIRELRKRELLDRTIVLCGGEFGRTPQVNPAGGRDHWPHGFSVALAGGGLVGGRAVGQTSPNPILEKDRLTENVVNRKSIEDIHATILQALGIDYAEEVITPIGRPLPISRGEPIEELLS